MGRPARPMAHAPATGPVAVRASPAPPVVNVKGSPAPPAMIVLEAVNAVAGSAASGRRASASINPAALAPPTAAPHRAVAMADAYVAGRVRAVTVTLIAVPIPHFKAVWVSSAYPTSPRAQGRGVLPGGCLMPLVCMLDLGKGPVSCKEGPRCLVQVTGRRRRLPKWLWPGLVAAAAPSVPRSPAGRRDPHPSALADMAATLAREILSALGTP